MHDQDTPSVAERYDTTEREVLYLLTEPESGQPLWSVEDIGREIETDEPMLPVRSLLRAGLVHRTTDGFVFATRAAVRMVQIVGHDI
ncbi:MAG TPA: hypothetical protein VGL54_00115 [Solirubrobacteraceae bacterium]|jgi:hypothetical protein